MRAKREMDIWRKENLLGGTQNYNEGQRKSTN